LPLSGSKSSKALKVLEGNVTDLKRLVFLDVNVMGINISLLASLNKSARKPEAAVALFTDGKKRNKCL
jgi:hypothetical protein